MRKDAAGAEEVGNLVRGYFRREVGGCVKLDAKATQDAKLAMARANEVRLGSPKANREDVS